MNEGIRANMIYDYFRWFHWPKLIYRKVEPVDNIQKEFPLEKREEPEREDNSEDHPKHEQERLRPGRILSIWV